MKSKRLLNELLDYIELFEQSFPDEEELSLKSFLVFVQSMQEGEHALRSSSPDAPAAPRPSRSPREVSIARHLSLLHRYSKGYIKRALFASQHLQSEEEYSYLASLFSGEPHSKTELNSLNAMEKTSGAEVIRRLVAKGLVEERPDERDRRSVLVSITPSGRAELMKVFPQLHTAAQLISAPLAERQQATLDFLLHYLCDALSTLPVAKNDTDLGELLRHFKPDSSQHHRPEI
ncbi:winged helix DNA-binding protein [uncultured Porphyromonas sp.]|uniref:MarR family winged helix-turn-helix transcriptional regulator n=1 Tax=uncultured Porphyromonas sp. TaxID=159274 RepID=UPI0026254BC6|nr:winged helix DNA-binding protein [uncultured Porphyromonas sp.]